MDRQLQKLRRDELLEILLEVEQENEQLTQKNLELRERLANREFAIRRAGTLANASVQVSGVLRAAQDAADMYLQNVKAMCLDLARETEELCAQAMVASNAEKTTDRPSLQDEVLRFIDQATDVDQTGSMATDQVDDAL